MKEFKYVRVHPPEIKNGSTVLKGVNTLAVLLSIIGTIGIVLVSILLGGVS